MTTAPRLTAGRSRVHIQPPIRLYRWFYVIPDFRFGGFADFAQRFIVGKHRINTPHPERVREIV
jgi:hypothetical protein